VHELVRLIKLARAHSLTKAAVPVGVPFSSLTARSEIAARGPVAEANEWTLNDQRLMTKLLQGMSKSRARVVDSHRRGRLAVQRRTP